VSYINTATSPKVHRWKETLNEYNIQWKFIAGIENNLADSLSRLVGLIQNEQMPKPKQPCNAGQRKELFIKYHSNHESISEMYKNLQEDGYKFKGMKRWLIRFKRNCVLCQKNSSMLPPYQEKFKSTMVQSIWDTWEIDIIGPLPVDHRSKKYILVCIDKFSRYTMAFALKNIESETIKRKLATLTSIYGSPTYVQTDNASNLTSKLMDEWLTDENINRINVIAYRHQAQGLVERQNANLESEIRKILLMDANLINYWSVYLPMATRILNTRVHTTTKARPRDLVFNLNSTIPNPAIQMKVDQAIANQKR
jgi:hypothetical protein